MENEVSNWVKVLSL